MAKYLIDLNFLGKDSVPYKNTVEVSEEVYRLFEKLLDGKSDNDNIFDAANSGTVKAFLDNIVKGASPKVLRTAKCNEVLIKNLKRLTSPDTKNKTPNEKLRLIKEANLEIAKQLNHQKNVSKNYDSQVDKLKDKIKASQEKLEKSKKDIEEKLEKLSKDRAKYKELYKGQRKLLKSKMDELDEKEAKLKAKLEKAKLAVENNKFKLKDKKATKNIALGTSLGAYADYRVIKSWCKYVDLPLEKVYTKSLISKFDDGKDVDEGYWLTII